MSIEFFQTGFGRSFFQRDVPSIARSLDIISKKIHEEDSTREKSFKKELANFLGVLEDFFRTVYKCTNVGPLFFQTYMGRKFYEGTMTSIAKSLEKIADNNVFSTEEIFELAVLFKGLDSSRFELKAFGDFTSIIIFDKETSQYYEFKKIPELKKFLKGVSNEREDYGK